MNRFLEKKVLGLFGLFFLFLMTVVSVLAYFGLMIFGVYNFKKVIKNQDSNPWYFFMKFSFIFILLYLSLIFWKK